MRTPLRSEAVQAAAGQRGVGDAQHGAGVDDVPAAAHAIGEARGRVAPHIALLLEDLGDHAQAFGLVLPVEAGVELRAGLVGQGGVHQADAGEGAEALALFERLARRHVDGAGQTAVGDIGLRGLVDRGLVQHRAGHQAQAGRAAARALVGDVPVAAAHRVAVEQDQRHVRVGAAHRHLLGLVVVGAHRHTGHALQAVGEVLVGHLADLERGDHVDVGAGVALVDQRALERGTDAGHHHLVELGRGLGHIGLLGEGRQADEGGGKGDGGEATARHGGSPGVGENGHWRPAATRRHRAVARRHIAMRRPAMKAGYRHRPTLRPC
jgi:hypothetical protein